MDSSSKPVMMRAFGGHNADPPGNAFCGQAVIAGDHHNADARVCIFRLPRHFLGAAGPSWQSTRGRSGLVRSLPSVFVQLGGEVALGNRQHTQTVPGQFVIGRHELQPGSRSSGSFSDCTLRCKVQHSMGAPLKRRIPSGRPIRHRAGKWMVLIRLRRESKGTSNRRGFVVLPLERQCRS